jgi:hypothetical protein
LKALNDQITKVREKNAKEGCVKKCCRLLGKLIMGLIILAIVSPFLINIYKGMTGGADKVKQ